MTAGVKGALLPRYCKPIFRHAGKLGGTYDWMATEVWPKLWALLGENDIAIIQTNLEGPYCEIVEDMKLP